MGKRLIDIKRANKVKMRDAFKTGSKTEPQKPIFVINSKGEKIRKID